MCVSVNGGTILCYFFISLLLLLFEEECFCVLRGDMLKMEHYNKSFAFLLTGVTFTEVCGFVFVSFV